jgi:hypothetical protein
MEEVRMSDVPHGPDLFFHPCPGLFCFFILPKFMKEFDRGFPAHVPKVNGQFNGCFL